MKKLVIATAQMRHPTFAPGEKRFASPRPLFKEALEHIARAAARKADIICLPETFANLNRSRRPESTAETRDGETMTFLQCQAKKYSIAIVATTYLREKRGTVNAGVAFTKKGGLAGIYRKVHAAPGEKIAAGDDFTVFELEGIRAGIQICHDLLFPEGCRCLALRGAEIIFWPNLWGGMPEYFTEVIMRARAIENRVFLVSAAMHLGGSGFFRVPKIFGRSCVIARDGAILAEVGHQAGTAAAQVDFGRPRCNPQEGEDDIFKQRRPGLYSALVKNKYL